MIALTFKHPKKPVARLTFQNCENLDVELKHAGNFFNVKELNSLTLVLDIPCSQRGLRALSACWNLHHTYDLYKGLAEQFFDFVEKIDDLTKEIKDRDFPEEFHTYIAALLTKLAWTRELYLKIATLKDIDTGLSVFKSRKFIGMKNRRLVKTVNKLIAQAEKTGLVASNAAIYQQSNTLTRTYHISFSVEPNY